MWEIIRGINHILKVQDYKPIRSWTVIRRENKDT